MFFFFLNIRIYIYREICLWTICLFFVAISYRWFLWNYHQIAGTVVVLFNGHCMNCTPGTWFSFWKNRWFSENRFYFLVVCFQQVKTRWKLDFSVSTTGFSGSFGWTNASKNGWLNWVPIPPFLARGTLMVASWKMIRLPFGFSAYSQRLLLLVAAWEFLPTWWFLISKKIHPRMPETFRFRNYSEFLLENVDDYKNIVCMANYSIVFTNSCCCFCFPKVGWWWQLK